MEASCLFDILDARVVDEGKEEEFVAVATLARQCLSMNGKQRPLMKEIAVVLDGIRSHKVPHVKEPESDETMCLVTKTNDLHNAPFRSNTFFSDSYFGSSGSIDVQPIIHGTF